MSRLLLFLLLITKKEKEKLVNIPKNEYLWEIY